MNQKIVDYKILTAAGPDHIEATARKLIKEGWQPYGYLSYNNCWFRQAMVKYEPQSSTIYQTHPGPSGPWPVLPITCEAK